MDINKKYLFWTQQQRHPPVWQYQFSFVFKSKRFMNFQQQNEEESISTAKSNK